MRLTKIIIDTILRDVRREAREAARSEVRSLVREFADLTERVEALEQPEVKYIDHTAEPAALPLAGVVLSGGWARRAAHDSMSATFPTGLRVADVWHTEGAPGGWMVWHGAVCIATGIGPREDAIAAARKLGATVRGDA